MGNVFRLLLSYLKEYIKVLYLTTPIGITIFWYIMFIGIYDEDILLNILNKIFFIVLYPLTVIPFLWYEGVTRFNEKDFIYMLIIYSLIFTIIKLLFKFILNLIFKREIIIFKNKKVKKYVILTFCNIQFIFWIIFLMVSDSKLLKNEEPTFFIIFFIIMMFINMLFLFPYLSIEIYLSKIKSLKDKVESVTILWKTYYKK